MTLAELKKFLADRPALSVRQLGIEAGYQDGKYLRQVLYQDRETVPPLMEKKLLPILKKYGWK